VVPEDKVPKVLEELKEVLIPVLKVSKDQQVVQLPQDIKYHKDLKVDKDLQDLPLTQV